MQDKMAAALYWHQNGQLDFAATLYHQVLAQTPNDPDALHLLGLLHHQRGEHAAAAALIGQAITLRPTAATYYVNLAEVHRALGQGEQAVRCCQTALQLHPTLFDAHFNLGVALQSLDRGAEAVEAFRRAAEVQPNNAQLHARLGSVLHQLGRAEEALTHFQRAAELVPHDAVVQANLGQLLLSTGHSEEAVPPCREAARLQPGNATLHLILADALRCAGQFGEARLSYLRALELRPGLAQAHANLGLLCRTQKMTLEALLAFQRAVALDPNNASYWKYLAEVHGDLTDFVAAIPCWQQALQLQPGQAAHHLGLSEALHETGRFAEAEEQLRLALRLEPDSAAAHFGLARLHEQLNDKAQAEAAYRTALRLCPTFTLAQERLVQLLRGRLPEAERVALEERLADPATPEDCRIKLLFALAAVHDARRDYPGAAECAGRAHALSLARARRREWEYDPESYRQYVEGLLTAFGRDFFQRTTGGGLATRRPVFIVGLPRSGTTLIEQILASHSRVHGAGELGLAAQTMRALPEVLGVTGDPLACVSALEPATIRRLAERHLERLAAWDGGRAERIIDKMPDNYEYLGLLAALFPQATILHCRRDLRDVAVSCWLTHFGWLQWTHDFGHIASRFAQYVRLMEHWRQVLPVTLHEVIYEEVVDDLEGTARRLVAACQLDWEPACLEFHRTRRPVRTASAAQVRAPLYRQSVGRWRNYERELADLLARLPPRA